MRKNFKKKKSLSIIFSLILSSFLNFSSELRPKFRFGQGHLLLPREIIISREEILVLDEVVEMTPGIEKIRFFSFKGKFLSQLGTKGQGPGEFGQAPAFYVQDKKIYILDSFRRMIHIFAADDKTCMHVCRSKGIYQEGLVG